MDPRDVREILEELPDDREEDAAAEDGAQRVAEIQRWIARLSRPWVSLGKAISPPASLPWIHEIPPPIAGEYAYVARTPAAIS